jgi:hypothetical protein
MTRAKITAANSTKSRFGFGAEAEDVSVGILDVKLQSPGIVRGWHLDLHAFGSEFFVKALGVVDAEPDPGSAASLISFAEVDPGAIAVHAGKFVIPPGSILESELIDIEAEAGLHVFHAENGLAVFEVNRLGSGVWHGIFSGEMITRDDATLR